MYVLVGVRWNAQCSVELVVVSLRGIHIDILSSLSHVVLTFLYQCLLSLILALFVSLLAWMVDCLIDWMIDCCEILWFDRWTTTSDQTFLNIFWRGYFKYNWVSPFLASKSVCCLNSSNIVIAAAVVMIHLDFFSTVHLINLFAFTIIWLSRVVFLIL